MWTKNRANDMILTNCVVTGTTSPPHNYFSDQTESKIRPKSSRVFPSGFAFEPAPLFCLRFFSTFSSNFFAFSNDSFWLLLSFFAFFSSCDIWGVGRGFESSCVEECLFDDEGSLSLFPRELLDPVITMKWRYWTDGYTQSCTSQGWVLRFLAYFLEKE